MSYSYKSIIDGGADSELIYYNANIINNQQRDPQSPDQPPAVRFNETRDAPIVRDASLYNYSIVRFSMNGPNKNLPLFIPLIQTNGFAFPTQIIPTLTCYYVAIPYQRGWTFTNNSGVAQTKIFTIAPESVPIIYRPEIQNNQIAPVPQVNPLTGIVKQDLSTRYYWVYTYKHWCDLVNEAFRSSMQLLYLSFQNTWNADPDINVGVSPFPYPTFASFLLDHDIPFVKYDEVTKLFEIQADTRAFNVASQLTGVVDPLTGVPIGTNVPLPAFVAPAIPPAPFAAQPSTAPYLRLFFNGNLFQLMANFKNTYFNATTGSSLIFPLSITPTTIPTNAVALTPVLYNYEILFPNQNYTNILNNNPSLQGSQAVPPPAYNPYFLIPTQKQRTYWIAKQDYNSTNSLWSPVQSIVFTSTLLPVKKEYTGKPIELGNGNISGTANSASAFEPIITDFVIDQQAEKAEGWRDFTLYEPTAEYKMNSLTASHDEIRNIDIQVFWKYRLTGELIPLTIPNSSDVAIKMLFRKLNWQ
jgi:hypothetical protein